MDKEHTWQGIEAMSRAKEIRRQKLARLPFEEKIKLVIQLQEIAIGMRKASGRPREKHHRVWDYRE